MIIKKRKAITLDNDSIFEEVKKWCLKGDLKINLKCKKWKEVNWKEVKTNALAIWLLLEKDRVKKADRGKVADSIIKHVTKLLKDSVKVSEELVDFTSLKTFFSSEYKGKTVFEFGEYLNECYNEWTGIDCKWHSPYFSVVQSSGYGKSKLCKEFAETNPDWLTVYVCLGRGTNRYPLGHTKAIEVLTGFREIEKREKCVLQMKRWINALVWLRVMFQYLFTESDETEKDTLKELGRIVNKVSNDYSPTKCYTDLMNRKKSNDQSDENKEEQANKERKAFWSCCEDAKQAFKMHSYVEKLQPYCDKKLSYQQHAKILLVIDEARFLVDTVLSNDESYSLFRGFRGALKEQKQKLFAVMVDTASRVRNFSPYTGKDPSLRIPVGDNPIPNTVLFSPFNWICTRNVLCEDEDSPFLYGRPLWKIFRLSFDDNVRAQLLDFAIKKLKCGELEVTSPVAMSVLSILTGLSISPISNLAEDLVASHMATCLAINESRDSLYVMYPVEPILSEAAFNIFREKYRTEQIKDQLLKPLVSYLSFGIVNHGHRGELVAKILLLLARSKEYEQFGNVTLKRYMYKLTNEGIPKKYDVSGDVSFTCFTKLYRENVPFKKFWNSVDPEDMLKFFYFHRAAIEFPEIQRGADLLIPICQASDDGTLKYKYILVQVKNVLQQKENTSVSKLDPKSVFEDAEKWCDYSIGWSLLINVAPGQEGKDVMHFKDDVLIVPCLDNFKHLLHVNLCDNLTDTFIDILRDKTARRWISEGKWDSLDSFNPLGNLVLNSLSNSQS